MAADKRLELLRKYASYTNDDDNNNHKKKILVKKKYLFFQNYFSS